MHGPTCICWANLTPSSLQGSLADLRRELNLEELPPRDGPEERDAEPETWVPRGMTLYYAAVLLCSFAFWNPLKAVSKKEKQKEDPPPRRPAARAGAAAAAPSETQALKLTVKHDAPKPAAPAEEPCK